MRHHGAAKFIDWFPKPITPRGHAVVDYATAGALLLAAACLRRRDRRTASLALANGICLLGLALGSDYPGGWARRLRFPTHAKWEILQGATAALLPSLWPGGAGGLLRLQAAHQGAMLLLTDFHPEAA